MVEHKKASDPDMCVWVFLKTYLFSMHYGCSYTHKQDDDVQKLFSVFRSRRNRHFERITETPANISICSIAVLLYSGVFEIARRQNGCYSFYI